MTDRGDQHSRPTVSVVIPTYNRADILGRAIRSVLGQTFEDFEVLIVDDASADHTDEVVRGFSDARIRFLRQSENAGVGAARNRGMREAAGQYVALLDSDDAWLPQKLERQVDRLASAPDRVALVYTGIVRVQEDGTEVATRPIDRGNVWARMLRRNVIDGTSTVLFRRSVIDRIGFFDEGMPAIEDYDYWVRLTREYEVDVVPEPLVRYYDKADRPRVSRALRNVSEARDQFYSKYGNDMRRLGVAHHFLARSAYRSLLAGARDSWLARRLALQAIRAAPTSGKGYRVLLKSLLPARVQHAVERKGKRVDPFWKRSPPA